MLKINDLACERQGRRLFKNLSFALQPGEILHVQGANGVGKSSLLRILCGLLEPTSGSIEWNNQNILQDRHIFTANISYLGHKLGLKSQLSVLENLQLFAEVPSTLQLVATLRELGVASIKHQRVDSLSAGQQQRVALARLLARKTRLWLLDEPTTSMDSEGIALTEQFILQHALNGGLVILTSHHEMALPVQTIGLN